MRVARPCTWAAMSRGTYPTWNRRSFRNSTTLMAFGAYLLAGSGIKARAGGPPYLAASRRANPCLGLLLTPRTLKYRVACAFIAMLFTSSRGSAIRALNKKGAIPKRSCPKLPPQDPLELPLSVPEGHGPRFDAL